MAKFASSITLVFLALVLFAAFEAPTRVEAQRGGWIKKIGDRMKEALDRAEKVGSYYCNKPGVDCSRTPPKPRICQKQTRPLGCKTNNVCRTICVKLAGALQGTCNNNKACVCYYKC